MTIQQNNLYLRGTEMMINFNQLVKTGVNVASKNAPAMLTAFGAIGVVGTAVLTAKATFEAANRIAAAEAEVPEDDEGRGRPPVSLTKAEKVKLVWPLYISAVTTGALSCGAIIVSHRISSRRAAVLAAAYALNEGKLEEYQEKIKEKFGVKEEKEARDEMQQSKVTRDVEDGTLIFDPNSGKVMLKDDYSGRYFYGNIEDVNRAVNEINHEILMSMTSSATVSDFYDLINLEHVSTSDHFGWNAEERLEIDWSTCTTPDGKHAVHVFEFVNPPVMNPDSRNTFR